MQKLLDHAAALGDRPGHAALRQLGAELQQFAATLDYAEVVASMAPENPRAMLARRDDGPILALRKYDPGHASTVHSHAWTVLVALEGGGALERWQPQVDGTARLVHAEGTSPVASVINGGEAHRQRSESGVLELLIVGNYRDVEGWQTDYEPDPESKSVADRFEAFFAAWNAGDVAALAPLYADDAFVDLHVPRWRVQIEGKEKVLAFVDAEEFHDGYHVPRWSASPTPDGWVVEVQPHYTFNGGPAMSENIQRIRLNDDGLIAWQSVHCTGIWDQQTIDGLRYSGGLLRP